MVKVQENVLLKLLPYSLRQDPVLVAMAEAAENQLKMAYREAEAIFNLVDIDQVPEQLLDLLAYEKHVDLYDSKWPNQIKKSVIKTSISHHRKKGTPSAVDTSVKKIFGDGIVDEWFNYGGKPYHFRVITEQSLAADINIKNLTSIIHESKNTRSWLEDITVRRKMDLGLNIGGAVSGYQITNIQPPKFELPDLQTSIHYGALVAKYDKTKIEMPPFTIAEAQLSKTYGGAFSYWQQTKIYPKGVSRFGEL
ncbi:phage tail protein I [Sporosarcina sp. P37]|uniref:phage tail protein I n=1 Tax=Sporosarcina sp. P37 TaxID=1930546 RepID=UPI000A179ECE|nr:phage tail protein I [Sporosarcina sp. P37]ARK26013.1 phage tail protein I [Sporosarcina sp. P37]